ncbi:TPA: hypothetical protein QFG14_001209 [Enterococcus faecium]|uniref:hypothetical protein n=1 Tax=Enterococcus TaxID=1350 RepID=UPI00190EBEAC|nr:MULTISPECIES: hypothetical protein [Enterococcus]MDG4587007.1 hypothetical protein [Enterococcus faecium]MDG4611618.1 hypothetical protein [Enterococcus lactis]MDG4614172.1 hypothetical protein [Enterococcus faecium]MDG4619378.1 hypothetical protein [Enterococcus lactis]MDG4621902.1 hypothetical protein [Enterococcus lactis]
MNKKELSAWAYLNEIEYCLQDETLNRTRALELIDITRDILTDKIKGDFEDLRK